MTEILKEELERIEKEAEEFAGPATEEKYPVGYLNRYEGFVAGAKAEHSHLQGRIAEKAQSFASWVANWAEYHEKMAKTKLSFKELWNIYKSVNP